MNPLLDATHHPALRSWVALANAEDTDFPLQNLPFGCFTAPSVAAHDTAGTPRVGIAIGDQVLDLRLVQHALLTSGSPAWALTPDTARLDTLRDGLAPLAGGDLNAFMALGPAVRRSLRAWLSAALAQGSPLQNALQPCLLAQSNSVMQLPCSVGDYTDFYTGIHHATTVGKLFRPDNPLLPNYKWVPIGYHGRASSLIVSGTPVRRPLGQLKAPTAETPTVGPCQRLDYELELGALIGTGNARGTRVPLAQAEDHLFGLVLLNDWSARDVQAWEYQPLGPFLAKNFASTLSPWVVTMEALAPFRTAFTRPAIEGGDPGTLPYLEGEANQACGAFDLTLEVELQTAAMRAAGLPPQRLSRGRWTEAAWWTLAQLVTHHTMGGCNLQPGDLLGTGTLSGPGPAQAGSLLELSGGGKSPLTLPGGETRTFLQDGDTLTLRAWGEKPGVRRIGLGACSGTVQPAA
ncbi:MAG: fumarylacetoacetase [Betaproteobacteria bacterium]